MLRLGEAQQLTIDAPQEGMPELEEVLLELQTRPEELSADETAQEARIDALLVLARAKLKAGDDVAAHHYLDEAIRCAHGGEVDAASLGPSMSQLEAGRRELLSARGTLHVQCAVPCRVFVDERETNPQSQLPAGSYRVHVSSSDPTIKPFDTVVELSAEGPPIELVYGPTDSALPESARSAPVDLQAEAPQLSPHTDRRLLPRWAELTGLALGVTGVAAGATLVALDGRCQGGGSIDGPDACDNLYNTDIAGFLSLGVGAAFLAGSSIMLTVDELRIRKGRVSSVNFSATFRF